MTIQEFLEALPKLTTRRRRTTSRRHPSKSGTRANHITTSKTDLDRLESLSKIVAAVAIPVILAVGTWAIQDSQTKQSVAKDYVNLALQIVAKKPESGDESGLRSWAVALLNKESPIPLAPELAARLTSGALHIDFKVPAGYAVGSQYMDSRRFDLAIEAFNLAEKEDPSFSMTYLMRGMCRYFQKEYQKSIPDFTRFTELEPSNASGYWQRGLSYFESKDYKDAIPNFEKSIEINKHDGSAHYQLGLSYLALNDTKLALAEFTKAILDDDRHALAHFERGKIYLQTQQYSQAVDDFTRVVDYERKFNDQHGILKEAETDLEKAKHLAGG